MPIAAVIGAEPGRGWPPHPGPEPAQILDPMGGPSSWTGAGTFTDERLWARVARVHGGWRVHGEAGESHCDAVPPPAWPAGLAPTHLARAAEPGVSPRGLSGSPSVSSFPGGGPLHSGWYAADLPLAGRVWMADEGKGELETPERRRRSALQTPGPGEDEGGRRQAGCLGRASGRVQGPGHGAGKAGSRGGPLRSMGGDGDEGLPDTGRTREGIRGTAGPRGPEGSRSLQVSLRLVLPVTGTRPHAEGAQLYWGYTNQGGGRTGEP